MFFSISALFERNQLVSPSIQSKTHDYTHHQPGVDYCFGTAHSETNADNLFYMTGVGNGIRQDDHILLQQNSEFILYRVMEIEYYSNVKDLWMALLIPIDQTCLK